MVCRVAGNMKGEDQVYLDAVVVGCVIIMVIGREHWEVWREWEIGRGIPSGSLITQTLFYEL